jgi:hypothetical protein
LFFCDSRRSIVKTSKQWSAVNGQKTSKQWSMVGGQWSKNQQAMVNGQPSMAISPLPVTKYWQ